MTKIKAPYNFVPLSKKVVFPSWANAVNHDVPFSDSESGTISLKIKAHSPIFVRDSGKNSDGAPDKFFQSNGDYYIPGSSIKGMLRSVLEVMTYSKMQHVNNDRYSVRDFQNSNIYPMLDLAKEVRAAWLWKKDETYFLQDCGKPGRIPHHWIDEFYHTDYRGFYKSGGGFKGNNEDHKSAKFKYEKFGKNERKTGFVNAEYGKDNSIDVRKFYKIDPHSKQLGTIVFTGQAGPRKEVPKGGVGTPSGKIHEFVFFDNSNKPIELDHDVVKNFFFAYFDQDKERQSIDWKYWKPKLDRGEKIPVFFRFEDEEAKTIKDLGLSYLYKIIYKNSVLDSVPESHRKDERDFSETMFGYIDNKQSLKGRIHIGHATAIKNTVTALETVSAVLSGPKASYYPNYIRQPGKNGKIQNYQTFMDDTAVLAGWKRYPVHKNGVKSNTGTDNVSTSFVPLKEGVEFKFDMQVHNLRKIELGALLSAISFHKTSNTFHSLGMAKPLGYGKITLDIISLKGFSESNADSYLKDFEAYMNYKLGNRQPLWNSSDQMTELLTMVSEHDNSDKPELAYMKMDPKEKINDFIATKKGNEYLDDYSNLVNKKVVPKSLITEADIQSCVISETRLEKSFEALDLDNLKESTESKSKKLVIDLVKTKIDELLTQLGDAKEKLEEKTIKVNKLIRKLSMGEKLDIDTIETNDKKAFDKLKKEIERFVLAHHGVNNYKKLISENKGGVLSKDYSDIVLTKVTAIFKSQKEKDQKKNAKVYKKKIEEWFGAETSQNWKNSVE